MKTSRTASKQQSCMNVSGLLPAARHCSHFYSRVEKDGNDLFVQGNSRLYLNLFLLT